MSSDTSWIILTSSLTLIIIIFIFLYTFSSVYYTNQHVRVECNCYGDWGVFPNVGANTLNRCGPDNTQPCLFNISSLSEAVAQCNQVKDFCNSFVYNETTRQMSIVDSSTSFASPGVDLFVRQHGIVPS